MRKSYKFAKKKKDILQKYRSNKQIKVPQLRIIDEAGNPLGVMSTAEALQEADDRGFDLVEVSPNAEPPVAKFVDYGKFQYQQEKLMKKQSSKIKKIETKGIRLSAKISEHDTETRFKQTLKFLDKGHKVKVEIILRGREHQHIDLIKEQLKKFIEKITIPHIVEQDITKQGSKIFMIIMPEKNNN